MYSRNSLTYKYGKKIFFLAELDWEDEKIDTSNF